MQRGGTGQLQAHPWTDATFWEERFDDRIEELVPEQIDIRRRLHAHPEPSGEEVETTAFIAETLASAGLSPVICESDVGQPVGVIADVDVGRPASDSPLIAIRADMDALRMPDEKTVPYRSTREGCAHACGHDAHSSILLGAALAATRVHASLQEGNGAPDGDHAPGVRLRLLFQPAEETSGGARWLVAQGAMEDVDAILGVHVDPERLVGEVGIRYGSLTANCDEVRIVIEGKGGHAARPHHARDPIAAAAHLVSALYEILPRTIDARDPAVFTIGKIAGGSAANVIPEKVELVGTLRTIEASTRHELEKRMQRICNATELSTGTRIDLDLNSPLGAVVNDPQVTSALHEAARRVVGNENAIVLDKPSLGGEDFSVYLDHAPGSLLRLGCATPGMDWPFLHSPLFDIDERTLAVGTRILVRAALLLAVGVTGDG